MRYLSLLGLLLTAACASQAATSAPQAGPARTTTTITSGGATSPGSNSATMLDVHRDTRGTAAVVRAPVDAVWAALPGVYEAAEIPVGTLDRKTRVIGNQQHQVRRRLMGKPLSHFVRCGVDAFGIPHADSRPVTLSVLTYVLDATEQGTGVETRVSAVAKDAERSSAPIECTSTGALEKSINESLSIRAPA